MKTSPTQRSLKLMRDEGYFCAITERWNQYAKVRQDLFGFVDVLCVQKDEIVAVQTTTGSNVSARLDKMRSEEKVLEAVKLWLTSPSRRIEIHGWRKLSKTNRWECRRLQLVVWDGQLMPLPEPVDLV